MSWQQIAQGGVLDADDIADYENAIAEGQKAKIELDLRWELPSWVMDELRTQLANRNIPGLAVYSSSPMLVVEWQKGFAWLAVITAVILGLIALAILIVGWRLFVEVAGIIPEPLKPLLGIAILAGLGLVVWNYGKKTFQRSVL